MSWTCFLAERTDRARESLRRYARLDAPCPATGAYHNASVDLGTDVPFAGEYNGSGRDDFPHDDPRWPTACACGYAFAEIDTWQHNLDRLYRDGGGRLFTLRDAPPGAMWDAQWAADHWHGNDGRCLYVKLPDGSDWCVDGPAANSDTGWQRTGEPPRITATPSIDSGGYHGFLQNGVLTDDIEGRTYG